MSTTTQSPIAEIRKRANISQRDLATGLGVHYSLIASLEAGLLDIAETDKDGQVQGVFQAVAEMTGHCALSLIERQEEFTQSTRDGIRDKLVHHIKQTVVEEWSGSVCEELDKEAVLAMIRGPMRSWCEEYAKSPVRFFREQANVSQRQFALAAGVSQSLVARVEAGQLGLYHDPRSGAGKLTEFLAEIFGGHHGTEVWGELVEMQERFVTEVKRQAKVKVRSALENLKDSSQGNDHDDC